MNQDRPIEFHEIQFGDVVKRTARCRQTFLVSMVLRIGTDGPSAAFAGQHVVFSGCQQLVGWPCDRLYLVRRYAKMWQAE